MIIRISGEKKSDLILNGDGKIIRQEKKYPILDPLTGLKDYEHPYYEVEIEIRGQMKDNKDEYFTTHKSEKQVKSPPKPRPAIVSDLHGTYKQRKGESRDAFLKRLDSGDYDMKR